jgi:hypothetical protein
MSHRWCSRYHVGSFWHWFPLLFCFPSSDSVILPLDESNKFLEQLRDVVKQSKGIFHLNV